jgi:hypothetical protein
MDASSGHTQRDVDLETVKSDLIALQQALDGFRRRSTSIVERQILEQPFQSVLVAFAAGFVFSRFMAHKLF